MRSSGKKKFLHFYRFLYRQFDEVNYFTVLSTAEREADQASSGCGIVLVTKDHKSALQLNHSFQNACKLRFYANRYCCTACDVKQDNS